MVRFLDRLTARRTAAFVAVLSSASVLGIGSGALAEAEPVTVYIDLESPRDSTDSHGKPLTISLRDTAAGEASFNAVSAECEPYQLTIQSALPVDEEPVQPQIVDSAALAAAREAPDLVPDELLPPYTTEPVPAVDHFAEIDPTLDDSQMEPVFGYAVAAESASFTWAPVEGADEYRISRDGELLETTDALEAAFTDLHSGSAYNFQFDAVDGDGAILSSRMLPLHALSAKPGLAAPSAFQPYNLALTYKTFIADARVGNFGFFETLGCGLAGATDNPQFGGDNRSWAPPTAAAPSEAAHYRTMMFTNVNWQNDPEHSVIYRTNIGATTLYRNGVLSETRTASGAITPSDAYRSGAYAQIHFQHAVTNPFCIAGAITYNATFRFYQSGTIEVAGSRYPVPNHEIYGRWNPSGIETWYPMLQAENEGFGCLIGGCTNPGIALSVTR